MDSTNAGAQSGRALRGVPATIASVSTTGQELNAASRGVGHVCRLQGPREPCDCQPMLQTEPILYAAGLGLLFYAFARPYRLRSPFVAAVLLSAAVKLQGLVQVRRIVVAVQ